MNNASFTPGSTATAIRAKSPHIRSEDGLWTFELSRDEWSHMRLTDSAGNKFDDVAVVPLFPITASKRWVSIVSSDGEELACLDSLDGLSSENFKLIEQELALREFIPIIEKVISVSGNQEPCEWVVQTNHGITSFVIKAEEDVRRVSAKAVTITDANGIRFRVEDMKRLDKRSRAFVEWYV
jgi:hypothetical protein